MRAFPWLGLERLKQKRPAVGEDRTGRCSESEDHYGAGFETVPE